MIDDEELRITFKVASEEHVQKLNEGLLHLEQQPDDLGKLEELMREAHSLKGDAGMLGVKDIATLAHQWEHLLGTVKRKETPLTPELCDRLYHGLDAIAKLVAQSVTGEDAGVNTFYVLAYLMGASSDTKESETAPAPPQPQEAQNSPPTEKLTPEQRDSPPETLDPIEAVTETETRETFPEASEQSDLDREKAPEEDRFELLEVISPVELAATSPARVSASANGHTLAQKHPIPEISKPLGSSPPPPPPGGDRRRDSAPSKTPALPVVPVTPAPGGSSNYRIDTIRVETRNLDSLMTQTGELTVSKIRIAHRLSEVEEIVTLWEEWSRDSFVNRFALEEVMRGSRNGSLERLQSFHHRTEERLERLGQIVSRLRNSVYEDNARLDTIADELEEGIRTLRLLPLSTIFTLFPRMVRDLAKQEGKQVELLIEGGETRADKRILEEMKDPLMHIIRNAIDHGIETPGDRQQKGKPPKATIVLKGYQTANNIVIEIRDDGRGLDVEKIKQTAIKRGICREEELAAMTPHQIHSLIFTPGFSTRTFVTEVSGRGVGLDVVRTNVERLKGSIHIDSTPGVGTTLRLSLGTTLATAHVLLVEVEGIAYALPVEFVQLARLVPESDIFALEGRETIILEGQPVSVVKLADLLELPPRGILNSSTTINNSSLPCIILQVGEERLGLLVDALVDEQDVVLKPQSKLLKRVRNVSGATILGTGEVCMVLNPHDLLKSVRKPGKSIAPPKPQPESDRKLLVLLVEDSIATRTQEKRILENAGYEVVTAVDGMDGYNKLRTRNFDAVISDVQMPNLDGLGLVTKIRQHKEYSELPIILVTSLASDDDKRRGAEAGANSYIPKSSFNQHVLLETLKRLI
ncbi:hybrid sensor histidine kinase/response regulator [Laspinema olomoucense]|uniref:histidine kinase n=1 Tax=Laspinema olomoucense D3b TaxID=2953688 RepID=A0ABT2N306_9CYAN|nr:MULTISPECIES: hybrid sensor histidine kinase/response regulator [unclassified Laspinema]MCT7974161.1 hybrid sensor histidine kinase/response regulator [Laspinema sp. D3d]MCT7977052.1 hybrid sensor histidine kinase/response regulator [Laspinema sp. D3b]